VLGRPVNIKELKAVHQSFWGKKRLGRLSP